MIIHASSKVIALTHILQLTYETKNNINKPFGVVTSIFVIAFKGAIISGTGDVISANQRQARFAM